MNQVLNKIIKILPIIFLVFFSFFVTVHYGHRGVFPIDSFIIFNGGYNILIDYHPFKDYWSITGPLLDYIQMVFFKLNGVNWLSYTYHAALINVLLSIFVYYFLNQFGLNKKFSFFYAIGTSLLAYTQTGTPFMDHHAFILCFISIYLLVLGVKSKRNIFWLLSSFFVVFSFLSKQIPSAYISIFFALIVTYFFFKKKHIQNILFFFIGGISAIFLFFVIILTNEIPIENFISQYILYPLTIGNDRSTSLNLDLKNTIFQFKYIHISLAPTILYFFFEKDLKNIKKNNEILTTLVITTSTLIFIYCQLLTKNQVLIFFIIPTLIGISQVYINRLYKKKYLNLFFIGVLILITYKYHIRFNEEKKFMELQNVNIENNIDAKYFDLRLKNLKWITPNYGENPKEELDLLIDSKNKILDSDKNFIVITDYQILPAFVDAQHISFNKWFDYLSSPSKENKFFEEYLNFSKKKLSKNNIDEVYLIDKSERFITDLFSKNCFKKKKMNKILTKIDISKCY